MNGIKKQKLLVFGATGKVGSEVMKCAHQNGISMRVLIRSESRRDLVSPYADDILIADYFELRHVKDWLEGVDVIFLIKPTAEDARNQAMVEAVATEAKVAGIQQIIYLSAPMENLPCEPAGITWHRESESMIQQSGVPYTFLRPHYFMQNLIGIIKPLPEQRDAYYFELPVGDGKRSTTDIRDIAEAAIKSMLSEVHRNKAYNITGPELLGFADIAQYLSEGLGVDVKYHPVPEAVTRDKLIQQYESMGFEPADAEKKMERQMQLYRVVKEGCYEVQYPDLKQLLGREPTHFSQFVRDYAEVLLSSQK